jgi:hypothetical protein
MASRICPASGAAYSPVALPVSSLRRLRAAVAEEEARVDLPEADLLEQDLADPLEQDLADPLEQDLAVPLEQDLAVPLEQDLAVLEEVRAAVVAARTPSSIPRMARFPTPWLLARSPTT